MNTKNMKITILGTGHAVPTKDKNLSSIWISFANENILIDCGEGTQRQMRIAGLNPMKLTKILITHWHGDHILGLPGLFETLALADYNKTLKIYGPRGTKRFISIIGELIFKYHIDLEVHEITDGKFIDKKEFFIETKEMDHGIPANAYSITIKDKIRLNKAKLKKLKLPNSPLIRELQLGKDITFNKKKIKAKDVVYNEKGCKISVILDTGINENAAKLANDSDLLICESSFLSEDTAKAREYKHLTATDAADIAKKSKSKKLILTHISQRYEKRPELLLKEAKKTFKNSILANDFDSFSI